MPKTQKVKVVTAHSMVASTAMELCGATYDELMVSNAFYSNWKIKCGYDSRLTPSPKIATKLRDRFIRTYWSAHIEPARATLAGMLALPYPDDYKTTIHEALVLDMTLKPGRARGQTAQLPN